VTEAWRTASPGVTSPGSTTQNDEGCLELELKFDVDEASGWRLLESLSPNEPVRHHRLVSVYFDTPHLLLRRNGLVLRIREDGPRRVQAVKSRGEGGGAFGRGEWESEVADCAPDFAAFAETPLAEICAEADRAALKPVFTVQVERACCLVAAGGATIEVVFDRGEVRLDGASSPIRELELELKSGPPQALFDLCRRLSGEAALDLSFTTKADRGYGLADARYAAPPRDPMLDPKTPAGEAFCAIAVAALAQMAANARILRAAPDVRALHQLRVGARRLRSAMSLFAPMLADDRRDAIRAELKWLGVELNAARNLDVFIDEAFEPVAKAQAGAPGLKAFGASLKAARKRAYLEAEAAVGSARFRSLMLETALWAEFGPWSTADAPEQVARRERTIRKTASELLERRFRRIVRDGRNLAAQPPETRHKLRIAAKKLRYACDFFADLYPDHKAAAFAHRMTALQDTLGVLNDIATGRGVVAETLAAKGAGARDAQRAYAAGLVVGARQADEPAALKAARKAWRQAAKADPFW
jgi:triphosphatase